MGFWLNPVIALNRRKPPETDRPTPSFQRHIKQESAWYTSRVLVLMNLFIPFLIFFFGKRSLADDHNTITINTHLTDFLFYYFFNNCFITPEHVKVFL